MHEVRPVTAGYRLTLIYNLVRKGGGAPPTLQNYEAQTTSIAALLRQWVDGKHAITNDAPAKLVIPLEHAYTSAELAFSALKNADAAAAAVLISAAAAADCELHLALLEIEESGSAEHTGYTPRGRGRWYRDDDNDDDEYHSQADDFEILDVIDSSLMLSDWRRPDSAPAGLQALPFLEDELCPQDIFADVEPDEQYFHEATGNEGASFERTYRRAAFVLWPRGRKLEVLDQAGLDVSLPYLADLTNRWTSSGETRQSILWRDAHALSALILARWQASHRYAGPALANDTTRLLSSLTRLEDIARIDQFLLAAPAMGIYHGAENKALVLATSLLAAERAADIFQQIVARNAHMKPSACANLLVCLANEATSTALRSALEIPARALVETLLGEHINTTPSEPWQRPEPIHAELIVDLLTALDKLGATTLAERAVAHMLSDQNTYSMDMMVIPAMMILADARQASDSVAIRCLRSACLAYLNVRIAEPLAAPHNFVRPCAITCRCEHCAELGRFLVNAGREQWAFKAAEQHRKHVEATIRRGDCDLDVTLSTIGRPYSLIATKNQRSYERRVVQRKNDLATRALLEHAQENT